jgi:hypothetical protein
MPTQSRPVVGPSIAEIKSSKADTFETITELDGGLGEDNKTIFTTTWRLDYDGRRVHFLKSRVDNGQQVDVVMQWMVRMSHRREQARVAKEVFKKARNTRMYGDIDIEKDILFIATAENDESDEPYLRLFAHKEDADLWVMLSKLDGETEQLRLLSVEPIEPREARSVLRAGEDTHCDQSRKRVQSEGATRPLPIGSGRETGRGCERGPQGHWGNRRADKEGMEQHHWRGLGR